MEVTVPQVQLHFVPENATAGISVQATGGHIAFSGVGAEQLTPIDLPCVQVTLSGRLVLARREMLLASFPSEATPKNAKLGLVAVIGWDGARMRILAIEPETIQTEEGADLSVRLASSADDAILRLTYELSAPRGPTLPFHLQWIDMLGFRPMSPLKDIAARPALAGSCQAALAAIRARLQAMLAAQPHSVSWRDLSDTGLLDFPHQMALATGRAAYPADMADP
jgi:hypothetical protein